jgi:hypothetical protein
MPMLTGFTPPPPPPCHTVGSVPPNPPCLTANFNIYCMSRSCLLQSTGLCLLRVRLGAELLHTAPTQACHTVDSPPPALLATQLLPSPPCHTVNPNPLATQPTETLAFCFFTLTAVHWIFKNKDHGKTSATASLGLISLWDVEGGLPLIDKCVCTCRHRLVCQRAWCAAVHMACRQAGRFCGLHGRAQS